MQFTTMMRRIRERSLPPALKRAALTALAGSLALASLPIGNFGEGGTHRWYGSTAHARDRARSREGEGYRHPTESSERERDNLSRSPESYPENPERENSSRNARQEDGSRSESEGSRFDERQRADHREAGQRSRESEPRTVEEWLRRMTKPERTESAARPPESSRVGRPSATPAMHDSFDGARVPHELLALNPSRDLVRRAASLGITVKPTTTLSSLDMTIARLVVPPTLSTETALGLLAANEQGSIAYNHLYRPYRPADSNTSQRGQVQGRASRNGQCDEVRCFGPRAIAWREGLARCAGHMPIGIVDTAVNLDHPALKSRRIRVGRFNRGPRPHMDSQHGTSTLAILAGTPDSATPGLLPEATYYAADIFHADNAGEAVADTVALLDALEWMGAWNVRLVNLSLTGPHDRLLQQAIARMSARGMIFVAAAGNDGPDGPPLYPAAYSQVIAVTAVARDLRSYRKANRGRYIDFAAPGVDIWTASGNGSRPMTGTSFAVPFATAVIAVTDGMQRARGKRAVLARLKYRDLGKSGPDEIYGRGLIQAPSTCTPRNARPLTASARPAARPNSNWTTSVVETGALGGILRAAISPAFEK